MNETSSTLLIFLALGLVAAFVFGIPDGLKPSVRGLPATDSRAVAVTGEPQIGSSRDGAAVITLPIEAPRRAGATADPVRSTRLLTPLGAVRGEEDGWLAAAAWLCWVGGSLWLLIAAFSTGVGWGLAVLFGNMIGGMAFAAFHPKEGGMGLALQGLGAGMALMLGRVVLPV